MKDVRTLCDKYGVKKINVLVPAEYQTCLDYGIDPVNWAENGCVDAVVILSHWQAINTDYQIDLWKRLLKGNAELGTGQQMNVKAYPDAVSFITTVEIAFGQATANLFGGSDFVYLYNYMNLPETKGWPVYPGCIRQTEIQHKMLCAIGDYESASKQKRTHVLSYDDYRPYWESFSGRLPIEFAGEGYEAIKIMTGGMAETETAELRLGFDSEIDGEKIEIYVNREKVKFKEYGSLNSQLTDLTGHIFEIKNKDIGGYVIVEIKCTEPAVLKYADITITQ